MPRDIFTDTGAALDTVFSERHGDLPRLNRYIF
jgi:hypothetical protein